MKAISLLLLLAGCASHVPEKDEHDWVREPMASLAAKMRDCYLNSSNYIKNPDSIILTKIEFDIQKDGSTTDHKVIESSLKDEKFKACLVTNLKELKYPPQKEVIGVTQPYNFYPRKP